MILLCLFAPKLYIVLFNPSKNIHSKFKTTLASKMTNSDRSKPAHHLDALIVRTINNHQRRMTPSDCPTELTFCQSKSNSWGMNSNDEITQTDPSSVRNSVLNGKCPDAQQRELVAPSPSDSHPTSRRRSSATHLSQALLKPSAPSLVISHENPWKRLGNVRYKLDEEKPNNSTPYQHVYAQHITFV